MNIVDFIQKDLQKILTSIFLLIVFIGATLAVINDNRSTVSDDTKISVVASYYPLYDFAKNIGGDRVNVINITPSGSEPHDYEPSPRLIAESLAADVFIYNGGEMEPWVDGFLQDYKNTVVRSIEGIEAIYIKNDDHEGGSDSSSELVLDPHFWLDPVLAQQIVDNILAGFISADPGSKDYYLDNANKYKQKLVALDDAIKTGTKDCKIRTVVSSHSAFSYFSKRYDLKVVSISGVNPEEEPSTAKMAEISDLVKKQGIGYIFFESLVSSKLADTIAAETGAKTLVFDPIEGLTENATSQGKDYIGVQQDNLTNLRTALACQ